MISAAPDAASGVVDSFRCSLNEDIEDFLRNKSIDFERRGLCTTYVYIDTATMQVCGYFSLTHKALSISELSYGRRKDIAGIKTAKIAPFILLAQLGKFKSDEPGGSGCSQLSGDAMMADAFAIIAKSNEYIINRRVLVECENEAHLISFYQRHGFKFLDIDREDGKCTLYLKLNLPRL